MGLPSVGSRGSHARAPRASAQTRTQRWVVDSGRSWLQKPTLVIGVRSAAEIFIPCQNLMVQAVRVGIFTAQAVQFNIFDHPIRAVSVQYGD